MIAWPEKIVGFLFVLELIIVMLIGLTAPTAFSPEWFSAFPALWRFPAFTLIPIWVILRMIDGLCAGPARRRGYINARFLP